MPQKSLLKKSDIIKEFRSNKKKKKIIVGIHQLIILLSVICRANENESRFI